MERQSDKMREQYNNNERWNNRKDRMIDGEIDRTMEMEGQTEQWNNRTIERLWMNRQTDKNGTMV